MGRVGLIKHRTGRRRRRGRWRTGGRILLALLAVGFGCAVYTYLTLPDVRPLRTRNPVDTAFMSLRREEALARGERPRQVQRWVPYARISRHLKSAVLTAEDSAFWVHDGVDYAQLKDAFELNLERMEFVRGASTITQQVAKNLYLSPARTPVRKLKELLIARRLEAELSKERILDIYLNSIEWGAGIYGAEAAAREYFGTSAAQLGPEESALLAAAIINPRRLDPGHPSPRLRRRQRMILARMGAVRPPAADAAPSELEPPPQPGGSSPAPPSTLPGEVVPARPPSSGRGVEEPRDR